MNHRAIVYTQVKTFVAPNHITVEQRVNAFLRDLGDRGIDVLDVRFGEREYSTTALVVYLTNEPDEPEPDDDDTPF